MVLFYTASQDASIYLQQPYQNTGIDEMLEISKIFYGDIRDTSRALIQFDTTPISKSIFEGTIRSNFTASLQLKIAKAEEISARFSIQAYAVSQSWENGTGTRFDNLTTNGASWYYRNGDDTTTLWNNTYVAGQGASFNAFTTGSSTGLGGTWYTSSVVTQSFAYTLEDIELNITPFVKLWNSGSIPNNGLILKFPTINEDDNVDYGNIKLFSKETNTIYQPKLLITYTDSGSVTGSIGEVEGLIDGASYDVLYRCYSPNLKASYSQGQLVSLKIDARELYPLKQFQNPADVTNSTFAYARKYYLPTNSYYSIIDTVTKEVVIPYSSATQLIRDNFNNLIKLNFRNWEVGRNYTLLIKVVTTDNEEIFEVGNFDIIK